MLEANHSTGLEPPLALPASPAAPAPAHKAKSGYLPPKSSGSKPAKSKDTVKAKDKGVDLTTLPTTDQALPFYGIVEGVFSLRDGGAAILLEFDGFDFESAGVSSINNLGVVLADAVTAISKIGGQVSNGVSVSYSLLQRKLDLTSLIAANRKAASRVGETGLAAFARNEEEYLRLLSARQPFIQRRNFIGIALTRQAYQAELYQAELDRQARDEQDDEIDKDADFFVATGGIGPNGKVAGTSTSGRSFDDYDYLEAEADEAGSLTRTSGEEEDSSSEGIPRKRRKTTKTWLDKLAQGWQEVFGGGSDTRNMFNTSASGIQLNPVSAQAITILNQKAEIMASALRQLGLAAWKLSSVSAAEVVAQMLALPTYSTVPLEEALEREIKGFSKTKASPRFPLGQAEQEQEDAPKISLFRGRAGSGNRQSSTGSSEDWGTIDGSSFGYVPLEFKPRHVRVGIPSSLSYAERRYRRKVGRRQYARATREGKNTILLGLDSQGQGQGILYHKPVASYFASLYSTGWPRQATIGVLLPLVTELNLEMCVTVQLVSLTKKKTQGKLEKQREQLELAQYTDNSSKAWYERKMLLDTIDELSQEVAGEEGGLILAGLRIAVRADNLASLTEQTGRVVSLASGVGITMAPALYNQALALYSTLPLGRDYIRTAPLFGKRTTRNMSTFVSSCLFPSLVPEQAAEGGIFVGRGSYGGLTLISTDKLLAPHGITYGASGAGKTMSKQLDISRRLTADPNLSVLYIDPQGVLVKLAHELSGTVLDMSAEAEKKVRLNFLDRFVMGGRPMPFGDLATVFITFLSLMQGQTLSPNEKAAITSALKRLTRHFELGDSLTAHLVAGLKPRFGGALNLAVPGQIELLHNELEKCYSRLRTLHRIPRQGYLIQVVGEQGRAKLHFSTSHYEREWLRLRQNKVSSRTQTQTQKESAIGAVMDGGVSEVELLADTGIELAILKTYADSNEGRNYYAGEGEVRVQIPFAAYDRILHEVNSRKAGGALDRGAWLNVSLLHYLCSDQPRRVVLPPSLVAASAESASNARRVSEWLVPATYSDSRGYSRFDRGIAQKTLAMREPALLHELTSLHKAEGRQTQELEQELAYYLGTHLVVDSGPVWFSDEGWSEQVSADFAEWFGSSRLFDRLSEEEAPIVLRDLLVGLRYGVPILSDLLPVLACEPYAYDIVRNLETFCDTDISGALFNGHTNVNIYNRFIVFDVKNVNDELRPLRMMQCMQLSWRLITSQAVTTTGLKNYLFVVDEFGVVANQAPEVASYVGILYKRSRAFGCAMWLIDQDASSLQSQAGRYAMSNAGMVEIMRQDEQDLAYWQQMFNLSEEEVNKISNFGPGEAFIILNEPSRRRKIQAKYTMSDGMFRILSTRQADVKRYIAEQQAARGTTDDKLALMLENLMGHNFSGE